MTAPTLSDWQHAFRKRDWCPWPGPRPLTESNDDRERLAGRREDIERFRHEVDSRRLILLSGPSGVGKSSLLWSGLIPDLEESGFRVAKCREWSGAADSADAAEFLAGLLSADLGDDAFPDDLSFFLEFGTRYGERAVIVLDQFEELLRDSRPFAERLFDVLIDINKHSSIKVIISLREEHLYQLRMLEREIVSFTSSHFFLEPIADAAVPEVIASGNRPDRPAIEHAAANVLADAWRAMREHQPTEGSGSVGLLHLQALLYILHGESEGGAITFAQVARRLGTEDAVSRSADPAQPFFTALKDALEKKLSRCREAAEDVGLNPYLVTGTRAVLIRMLGGLSSGDFKLVRETRNLAISALGDEFDVLQRSARNSRTTDDAEPDGTWTRDQFRVLLDNVVRLLFTAHDEDPAEFGDLLSSSRRALARRADITAPLSDGSATWEQRLHLGTDPHLADPASSCAGPLFGLAPAHALIEHLRCFAFALEWLRSAHLARLNDLGAGKLTVAFVHDGFGSALEDWIESQAADPVIAINSFTAQLAPAFVWADTQGAFLAPLDGLLAPEREPKHVNAPPSARFIVNQRWPGAYVRARFRNFAFVNCDLRGVAFDGCEFEGVAFVNCQLDGTSFSECLVRGTPTPPADNRNEPPFEYLLSGSQRQARDVEQFLSERSASASGLLARLPGFAALPVDGEGISSRATVDVAVPHGSLEIRGGRLTSLLFRSCRFEDSGSVVLVEATGAGVSIVDQVDDGTFQISNCALRHLTFSSRLSQKDLARITVSIDHSVVVQGWIGSGLSGTIDITDSKIYDLWNSAPGVACEIKGKSRYHSVVGVRCIPGDSSPVLDSDTVEDHAVVDADGTLSSITAKIDYTRGTSEEGDAV